MDIDALWQAAQERWPEVDKGKTHLIFTEMLRVVVPMLKEEMPDEQTSWAGAILSIAELTGEDTGLSFDERIELRLAASPFDEGYIALGPVGDFMMGYVPHADLLAVQGVQ